MYLLKSSGCELAVLFLHKIQSNLFAQEFLFFCHCQMVFNLLCAECPGEFYCLTIQTICFSVVQVIESVFQQDRGQAGNILGGKGQATAMAALKELRQISNLLSEM